MTKPVVATLDPQKLPQKFSNMDYIGPIYLRMHMSIVKAALGVNKWADHKKRYDAIKFDPSY